MRTEDVRIDNGAFLHLRTINELNFPATGSTPLKCIWITKDFSKKALIYSRGSGDHIFLGVCIVCNLKL